MTDSSDLVMMTDVHARRALRGRAVQYAVLRPFGAWLGRGVLRVLRVRPLTLNGEEDGLHLTLGYESYEQCAR